MNYNKFTKAELIKNLKDQNLLNHKLLTKSQDTNNIEKDRSEISWFKRFIIWFNEILNLIKVIQELFFKITLITFIIKFVRKYKWAQRIFKWLRSILFFSLGTSFINSFGILENFMDFWMFCYSKIFFIFEKIKAFYNYLLSFLITIEDETDNETPEPMEHFISKDIFSQEKEGNQNEENNWKRILIFTTIVIIGCLIWEYWDDIKELYNKDPKPPSSPDTEIIQLGSEGEIVTGNKPNVSIDIKGKNIDLSSPGSTSPNIVTEVNPWDTHNLSSSPTESISSTETIIAGPSDLLSRVNLSGKTFEQKIKMLELSNISTVEKIGNELKKYWKSFIDEDIYEGISYIEKHFPKMAEDNTETIENMIREIKISNMRFAGSSRALSSLRQISIQELTVRASIAQETESWIKEIEEKLNNLV